MQLRLRRVIPILRGRNPQPTPMGQDWKAQPDNRVVQLRISASGQIQTSCFLFEARS